jgi:hypothetical protein
MAAPPLLRATLLEEGEKADSVLVLTAHHLVFDAYSGKVLLSDLARAYAALAADSSPGWTAPEANFPDFVSDECTWLQSADADEAWRYWQVQLSGLPDLELPGETEDVSFNLAGDSIPFHIDAASAGRLAALAAAHRTTPFTVLLTAWQSALHAWTGQPDLSVAVPVSMRDDRRFAAAVGNFVNIVLMRSRAGRPVPFEARLAAARETVLDGLKHKAFPFTDLVDRLRFRRRGLVLPQARVTFNLLQATPAGEFPLFDWRVSPLEVRQQEGHYDVSLALWESAGALTGWIKYRTGAVQPREIRDLAAKLQGVIEEVTCGSLVGIPAREELEW